MTEFKTKHLVTFQSPGSFYNEESTREIGEWDTRKAVEMAHEIVERYGARPYAFVFKTMRAVDPIIDPDGVPMKVEPRTLKESGRHFIEARLRMYDAVAKLANPDESILLANMRNNEWWVLAETTGSSRCTQPFNAEDVVVDFDGAVIHRGDEPGLVEYRARMTTDYDRKLRLQG